MNDLPVLRLTQLLTPEEIKTVQGVKATLEIGFCPIGVCIPDKSRVSHQCHSGEEHFGEERYTPLAYYAVTVWKETVKRLASSPEFANALEVEWYPVAATFRSIRYINDRREQYIQEFWKIAAEIADMQNIKIHYGRFDSPAPLEYPDYPVRTYVMTEELFKAKCGYTMNDEVSQLPKDETFSYLWHDIKDFFVELSPQQLAFNAGDLMNNCGTELDQQFIKACGKHDLALMKELFAQGANIHAVSDNCEMAAQCLVLSLFDDFYFTEGLSPEDSEKLLDQCCQKGFTLLKWLIQQGYDLNICAYDEGTALYYSIDYSPGIRLMKFLLENGADPNIACYINNDGGDTTCALENLLDNYHIWDVSDFPLLDEMKMLLKQYGAE